MNEFPLLGLELMALSAEFTDRGLPALVTQYDNATVGSGSIVDEVKHTRGTKHESINCTGQPFELS